MGLGDGQLRRAVFVLVAAMVVVIAGVGTGNAEPAGAPVESGPGWRVRESPFALSFTGDDGQVTGHPETPPSGVGPGARLSYELEDGSRHTVTDLISREDVPGGTRYVVATDESARTARIDVTTAGAGVRVDWVLQPRTGVVRVYEALSAGLDDHFLGSGIRALYVDLARRVTTLQVHFTPAFFLGQCNQTSTPVPFFASTAGWGLVANETDVGRMAFPGAVDAPDPPQCFVQSAPCPVMSSLLDRIQLCLEASSLSYDILPGDLDEVHQQFTGLVGRTPVPPAAQFGLVKWRESVAGADELLDDIDQMQQRDIPITSVLLDNPWETDGAPDSFTGSACVGSLTFDEQQFPDAEATIRSVHERGVRFVLWVAPFYSAAPGCPDPGYPPGSVVEGRSQAAGVPPPFDQFVGAPPPRSRPHQPGDARCIPPATRRGVRARRRRCQG